MEKVCRLKTLGCLTPDSEFKHCRIRGCKKCGWWENWDKVYSKKKNILEELMNPKKSFKKWK